MHRTIIGMIFLILVAGINGEAETPSQPGERPALAPSTTKTGAIPHNGLSVADKTYQGTICSYKATISFRSNGTFIVSGDIEGTGRWLQKGETISMQTDIATYEGNVVKEQIVGQRALKDHSGTQRRCAWSMNVVPKLTVRPGIVVAVPLPAPSWELRAVTARSSDSASLAGTTWTETDGSTWSFLSGGVLKITPARPLSTKLPVLAGGQWRQVGDTLYVYGDGAFVGNIKGGRIQLRHYFPVPSR